MSILLDETNKYNITINNFEGPLDLLCYLIDKKKTNIFDISLSELTDVYLAYLDEMEKMNLEIASEFLIMASNLLYIKSKKLLPEIEEEEEDEESEEDIMKRIIEYKKYKRASEILRKMHEENFGRLIKSTETIEKKHKEIKFEFTVQDLNESYCNILNRNKLKINKKAEEIKDITVVEKVTVKSKVREMISVLFKKTSFVFNKMFDSNEKSKIEVVTAFLGMLELARLKKVNVEQENLFGDIIVKKIDDKNFEMDLEMIEE